MTTRTSDSHCHVDLRAHQTAAAGELPAPIDLFFDSAALVKRLQRALALGDLQDVFLLAAGLQQMIEDQCGKTRNLIRRASKYLDTKGSRLTRYATDTIRWFDQSTFPHGWARVSRNLFAVSSDFFAYVEDVAKSLVEAIPDQEASQILDRGHQLLSLLESCVRPLESEIVRLPSCFRSFDQRPSDVVTLVQRFAKQFPDRSRPIEVIGVRTSGSYLAPIGAAALRRLGYHRVRTSTIRPGWPIDPKFIERHRAVERDDGLFVILDDPPTSGYSLRTVIGQLQKTAGINKSSIVLMLGLFDHCMLPEILQEFHAVVLSFRDWGIWQLLEKRAIADLLQEHTADTVQSINALEWVAPERGHVRAHYAVTLKGRDGQVRTEEYLAEGVGVGYYGRQVLELSSRKPGLFPEIVAFRDGLLVRQFLPSDRRLRPERSAARSIASTLTTHLIERKSALGVGADRSLQLAGRLPAWEVAANLTARNLGPLAKVARPLIVDPAVKRALSVTKPSIIDGSPFSNSWFFDDSGHSLVKADFAEGPYSHLDLASYDALFDLTGAAVAFGDQAIAKLLRIEWQRREGPIDSTRWMLLLLVQIWNARRLGRLSDQEARRAWSRSVQEFFSELFLEDLPGSNGPLVAIDLDGVLETSPLGFPAPTLAAGLSLRALLAHNFRLVLASGRSLTEIAERNRAYRTAGGIAEYGSFLVDDLGNHRCLLSNQALVEIGQIQAAVSCDPSITVDSDYTGTVRLFTKDHRGRRRHVGHDRAYWILRSLGLEKRFREVHGEEQTDIVSVEVSKGRALTSMTEVDRSAKNEAPLYAAIGDSDTDIDMLSLAAHRFAPANASQRMRSSDATILSGHYQLGLAEAVSILIGHPVGTCGSCKPPEIATSTAAIIELLSLHEGGKRELLTRIGRMLTISLTDPTAS